MNRISLACTARAIRYLSYCTVPAPVPWIQRHLRISSAEKIINDEDRQRVAVFGNVATVLPEGGGERFALKADPDHHRHHSRWNWNRSTRCVL